MNVMSALDQAIAELEQRRAKENAERNARLQTARAFLKAFYDADVKTSKKLELHGVRAVFDGKRILLEKPEVGVYADGMMIVVGEQGEIDVNGKSLGTLLPDAPDRMKKELIGEIISHFSL
jgi:hypothetical protein